MRRINVAAAAASLLALFMVGLAQAQQDAPAQPVVRMFYFYSESCGHCQAVSREVLTPLRQQYGDRLQIREFEFDPVPNYEVMLKLEKQHGIKGGVPEIFIGNDVLVGEIDIKAKLPGLIERYLAAGGTDWPSEDMPVAPIASPAPRPRSNGFELAVVIMLGMVAALIYTGLAVARTFRGVSRHQTPGWLKLAIPLLALAGLGVASYLAYVETQSVRAICGPVGDCNLVQSSRYARLFGVLPIGVLGAVGYVGILAAWIWGRLRSDWLADYVPLAIFGMTLFGTLFSLYLTYLEPFVIRAVCIWCLTSAVIITLLMLLSVGPALQTVTTTE
jgi:uncharacterized membrane protein